ncbi:MAG: SDR family oxidoreductase [candidate division KSB1 bacterium]|nr:SDR family oxidoreductase [candidate division KSB1 bacterium]
MSYIQELYQLNGKTAVITGGTGVLSQAMAEGLGKAGCRLVLLDINAQNCDAEVERLRNMDIEVEALVCNVLNRDNIEECAQHIATTRGEPDILINAAGVNSSTPFFDITEAEYDKIMGVNLKGTFFACQVFGQRIINADKPASIINISSASSGPPLSRVCSYSISKAGINNLTQFLAREWAQKKIRVNALAPGFFPAEQNRKILTEERVKDIMGHTPMNRFGDPKELIGAVIWLASEKASSFVTGSIIRVDGGFSAMTI